MIYKFVSYKNISLLADIILLNGYSVSILRPNETINQALERIGISFDDIYPDYIIK